ncbi:MAG TPA: class I SAM-dependent methyltransferase [Pirellulales bacterium]|nr:class I SAM-dependent methyltransferase [Pirellulales bacterium]
MADRARLVELGSWLGLSTRFIADRAPNAVIVAVNHWRGSAEHLNDTNLQDLLPILYETFLNRCWRLRDRIIPLRMNTLEALDEIAGCGLCPDLVYLDADHSYEAVRADLERRPATSRTATQNLATAGPNGTGMIGQYLRLECPWEWHYTVRIPGNRPARTHLKGSSMSAPQSSQGQAVPSGSAPTPPPVVPLGGSPRGGRFVRPAVAAAAALVAWCVVQAGHPFFSPPIFPRPPNQRMSPPSAEEIAMTVRCTYLNAMAVAALAGGLVAAAIGLAEGLRRRSAKLAVLAMSSGAILAGAAGAAGGWCGQRTTALEWLLTLDIKSFGDTPRMIAIQAACWSVTGLGIGLSLGIPLACQFGATTRAAARGVAGGLLAALVHLILVVVVGIWLPVEGSTSGLIPDAAVDRFLWLEAGAVCIALAVGAASNLPSIPRARATTAPVGA